MTIEDFYDQSIPDNKRRKLSKDFLYDEIFNSIFKNYPLKILHRDIEFIINDERLLPNTYIDGEPELQTHIFIDPENNEQIIDFKFFNLKIRLEKKNYKKPVSVFLAVNNAGLITVAEEIEYNPNWLSPEIEDWFVYVSSDYFTSDFQRQMVFEVQENKNLKSFIKEKINNYFRSQFQEYYDFNRAIEEDSYYPYNDIPASSKSKQTLFKHIAFLVEKNYGLLKGDQEIRKIVYPLIDKAISNSDLSKLLNIIGNIDPNYIEKFTNLLNYTSIENIVSFSDGVFRRREFIDFLNEIVYGETANHIDERKHLQHIIAKNLWIFGESYNIPFIESDKSFITILKNLHRKYMEFKEENSKNTNYEENYIELDDRRLSQIPDLFFINSRFLDDDFEEIMIVELKKPGVSISQKELAQLDRYIDVIEINDQLPIDKIKYKLILISTKITDFTRRKVKNESKKKGDGSNPFLYDSRNDYRNIEAWVICWSDLINQNEKRLSYLSNKLEINDISVQDIFQRDFPNLFVEGVTQ